MSDAALFLPRPLAIRLLHEAQARPDAQVLGLVGAGAGGPVSIYPVADEGGIAEAAERMRAHGERLWAVCRTQSADVPAAAEEGLQLIVSLDTKGVLKLTCWERNAQQLRERMLKIIDPR